jgi:hypothetical protein
VHADAVAGAAVPSASAEPVPIVDPDDHSDDRHPERSPGPARLERSLPGSTQAPTGADERTPDARRRTRPASWNGPGQTCSGYSGYSKDTAADNVSSPKPRTRGGYSEDTQKWA